MAYNEEDDLGDDLEQTENVWTEEERARVRKLGQQEGASAFHVSDLLKSSQPAASDGSDSFGFLSAGMELGPTRHAQIFPLTGLNKT